MLHWRELLSSGGSIVIHSDGFFFFGFCGWWGGWVGGGVDCGGEFQIVAKDHKKLNKILII